MIFIGLPGSGKSTFYREKFASTHALVSKDLMSPNNRRKDFHQREQIIAHFRAGKKVVVDNTHPTREARALLISLAREFGARVVGVHFTANVETCIARNAQREGRAKVPNVAIYAIAKKMEPPSPEEGFDDLQVIE